MYQPRMLASNYCFKKISYSVFSTVYSQTWICVLELQF